MEKEYWMVIFAAILSGLVVFGAGFFSEMGLSFYEISFLHGLFIFLLLPFIIFKKECRIKKSMFRFFATYGLLAFIANFTEFLPVVLGVPVAVVVLLLYTQPLWTVLISKVFLKEHISKIKYFSTFLVIIGVIIVVNPLSANLNNISILGIMLSTIGGLIISLWIILGRVAGKRDYHPVTTKFGYYLFNLIYLALFYPLFVFFVGDISFSRLSFIQSIDIWIYLFLYAIGTILFSHLLYYYGAKKVPASTSGIIFLLEPVVAGILASVVLGQIIGLNVMIGGSIIILSNYLVLRNENVKKSGINREPF